MSLIIDSPVPILPTTIKIGNYTIDLDSQWISSNVNVLYDDGSAKVIYVVVNDWVEQVDNGDGTTTPISHNDFTDFYANWTTQEQLYNLFSNKLGFTGTYNPAGEPQ